jgi:hypothetical protein
VLQTRVWASDKLVAHIQRLREEKVRAERLERRSSVRWWTFIGYRCAGAGYSQSMVHRSSSSETQYSIVFPAAYRQVCVSFLMIVTLRKLGVMWEREVVAARCANKLQQGPPRAFPQTLWRRCSIFASNNRNHFRTLVQQDASRELTLLLTSHCCGALLLAEGGILRLKLKLSRMFQTEENQASAHRGVAESGSETNPVMCKH